MPGYSCYFNKIELNSLTIHVALLYAAFNYGISIKINVCSAGGGMDINPEYVFFAVFAAFAGYFLYQMATKGFKGAMFGGRIEKTYGEIELEKQGIMSGKLKIHRIASSNGSKVGIEVVHKSLLSFQMVPATLRKEEVRRLIQLLTQATNET